MNRYIHKLINYDQNRYRYNEDAYLKFKIYLLSLIQTVSRLNIYYIPIGNYLSLY